MENQINDFTKKYFKGDYQIWFIVILLNIGGLIVQFSAKGRMVMNSALDPITGFAKTFAIWILSFFIISWFSRSNYLKLGRLAHLALLISWALILMAYLFGSAKGGASRWIEFGPISFMPSDMAKLALTASLARDFSSRQSSDLKVYDNAYFIQMVLKIGITCFLIMLSNFSTSILVLGSSIVLMYFGRVPYKQIVQIIGVFMILGSMVVFLGIGQRAQTVKNRILNFAARTGNKEVSLDQKIGEDYQIYRSLFAIATGGLSPKGPGKSQQRYFLSQAESDFIFAIIIEEYGLLIGGLLLPLIYLWFLYRGARSVQYASKPFGGLLAAGLTSSIVFQAFVNMFVSVDFGPVTGQPMPMISAGGTSLLFTAISIGLILSVSEDKNKFELNEVKS